MMHYYIDGYNLLFRTVDVESGDFQSLRQSLIHDLNTKASSLKLNVSVVFDSHQVVGAGSRGHFKHLEIIYSPKGITADDHILQILENSSSPSLITVVTSDKPLANKAKDLGASVVPTRVFMQWLFKRYANSKRSKAGVKLKPKVLNLDLVTTVPNAEVPLKNENLQEGSTNYYLQQFEKSLASLPMPKKNQSITSPIDVKKKRSLHRAGGGGEAPSELNQLDEMQRWLRIFEKKDQKLL